MCTRLRDVPDGILDASAGRTEAAHAKWRCLTPGDLSGIANKQDLISTVATRYNLSHAAAVQDVELWDARVRASCEMTTGSLIANDSSP
jgi:hypothetical protein